MNQFEFNKKLDKRIFYVYDIGDLTPNLTVSY